MIDGKHFFDQPVKNVLRTYDNVRKITISQGDDYPTGCLLDYPYFKENYDLNKQQVLDADPKEIQQINFTGNLNPPRETAIFSLLNKQKKLFYTFYKEL